MNDRVRIADLPSSSNVDKDSYMLVERPGIGQGTYKTTLGDIQEAITVRARVDQEGKITTIYIKDITGEYTASIQTPTAKVVDNGDNTVTLTLTDTDGVTESTVVSKVVMDPYPIEGSPNLVSSGNVWVIVRDQQAEAARIDDVEADIADTVAKYNELLEKFAELQDEVEAELADADRRIEATEETVARSLVVEDNQEIENPFSIGGGIRFNSLEEAILASHARGTPVKLFSNAHSSGVLVPESTDFILDLNGHELTILGPGAGAEGYEVNGMQLLKGTNATIKNGKLNFVGDNFEAVPLLDEDGRHMVTEYNEDIWADEVPSGIRTVQLLTEDGQVITVESGEDLLAEERFADIIYVPMLTEDGEVILAEDEGELLGDTYFRGDLQVGIDNYSNLTLDDVQITGNEQVLYVLFNSFGNIVMRNKASITAAENNVAFNAWYGSSAQYDDPGVFVSLEDDTVAIDGRVEFGKDDRATPYDFKMHAGITTPEDYDLDVDLLTIPCDWIMNGDGTKTLKYTGI